MTEVFKPMKVCGVTISTQVQKQAWDAWKTQHGLAGLRAQIASRLPDEISDEVPYRAADRLLQKSRKAGLCVYIDGEWYRRVEVARFELR